MKQNKNPSHVVYSEHLLDPEHIENFKLAIQSIDLNESYNPFAAPETQSNASKGKVAVDLMSNISDCKTGNSTQGITSRTLQVTKRESSDSPTVHSDESIGVSKKLGLRDNIVVQQDDPEILIKKRLLSSNNPLKLRSNLKRKIKPLVNIKLNKNILRIITLYFHANVVESLLKSSKKIRNLIEQILKEPKIQQFKKTLWVKRTYYSFSQDIIYRNVVFSVLNDWNAQKLIGKNLAIICEDYSYKFDIVSKETNRHLWLHKNDSACNGSSLLDQQTYVQPVVKICLGDDIVISYPSHLGFQFKQFLVEEIPKSKQIEYGEYQKPNLQEIMYNTKNTLFYKKDYYHIDLLRTCDLEEMIPEWYDLDPNNVDQALENYGFLDLVGHHEDFEYILTSFQDIFTFVSLQVGGTYFRVLKICIRAQYLDSSYYPLIDSYITIKNTILCNEVKRSGMLIDSQYQPVIELRKGDVLTIYLQIGGDKK